MQANNIVNVPSQFRFQDLMPYPEDNIIDFEYWLSKNIKSEDIPEGWTYLPITFTAYYKKAAYGKDRMAIALLQMFLWELDKSKKYFFVCQYDDGILNDIKHLQTKVFSMSGKPMDYPLPLICQPHEFKYEPLNFPRSISSCFIGANTHSVRDKMFKRLKGINNYFIEQTKLPLNTYCKILQQSVFSLCPRGYGPSSFRIMESLQYGAIPVYISDEFIEPHNINFDYYGLKVHLDDVYRLPEILSSMEQTQIDYLRKNGKYIYEHFYTFEANKELILKNLK